MSILHSKSFRQLQSSASKRQLDAPDAHKFMFNRDQLSDMSGSMMKLAEMGGVQGLAYSLRSNPATGLLGDESESSMQRRRDLFGINVYDRPPLPSFLELCWEGLQDPIILILIIAGIISLALGSALDPEHGWTEGLSICIAVILVDLVSASNQYSQQKRFSEMEQSNDRYSVSVIRDGKLITIMSEEVVVGDIVKISAGCFIPADGIICADDQVKVDESRMTGESIEVTKSFNEPFLFGGTECRNGEATMLVTAVGNKSAFGKIMAALSEEPEPTPLQKKLERAATLIGYIGAVMAVLIFIVLLIRWLYNTIHYKRRAKDEAPELVEFFIIAVTVIVVSVPEGLPLAVIVSLAYSMRQMYEDNLVVRHLEACETMGNCTCICSDKTGTLTQNLMTVVRAHLGGVTYDDVPSKDKIARILPLLVDGIAINSKAYCSHDKSDKSQPPERWTWNDGNQTEVALLGFLVRCYQIDIDAERELVNVEKSNPFDSVTKQSNVIFKRQKSLVAAPTIEHEGFGANVARQYYKGAAENILELSDRQMMANGEIVPIDQKTRDEINNSINSFTSNGLRTIGFCYRVLDELKYDDNNMLIEPDMAKHCILLGFVGIQDPLRPETKGAVAECQQAGIVVRMVTGDHIETAKCIARQCGILTSPDHISMTGAEFRRLIQANVESELLEIIPRLRVLARSKPDDKEALVRWLLNHGQIVAATGDGTNDAPQLKLSSVGIAMGIAGTAVAKSASDIVIRDDNFLSIVNACLWGRSVYDNIRKFLQFQLTVNVVALILTFVGAIAGYENPLKAVQLLWVNLIMDTMGALALGTEPPLRDLLKRRPFDFESPLISQTMWRNLLMSSVYELFWTFFLLFAGDKIFPDMVMKSRNHFTLIFNTFVWLQLFNLINSRKVNNEPNVFQNITKSRLFWVMMFFMVAGQALMVEVAGAFAQTTHQTGEQWAFSIFIGATIIPFFYLFIRPIPVNFEEGQIDVPAKTFEGAEWLTARNSKSSSSAASASASSSEQIELVSR